MEKLDFTQQLIIKIVDSGIIGGILLAIGYYLNKNLSKFNNDRAKLLESEKQNLTLKNAIIQDKRERKLIELDNQLSEFYYPIYYRLQKDNALWRLSPKLSNKKGALPIEANDIIEKEYILKNHLEIVSIIESKSHLIDTNPELHKQVKEYIKHVAIYNTIRKVDSLKQYNPIDFDSNYPKQFEILIENKITALQAEHGEILDEITLAKSTKR